MQCIYSLDDRFVEIHSTRDLGTAGDCGGEILVNGIRSTDLLALPEKI